MRYNVLIISSNFAISTDKHKFCYAGAVASETIFNIRLIAALAMENVVLQRFKDAIDQSVR